MNIPEGLHHYTVEVSYLGHSETLSVLAASRFDAKALAGAKVRTAEGLAPSVMVMTFVLDIDGIARAYR